MHATRAAAPEINPSTITGIFNSAALMYAPTIAAISRPPSRYKMKIIFNEKLYDIREGKMGNLLTRFSAWNL